ncbi:MAG: 4-alpha-glucanotransferase [Chloroflexota bacterium]
MNFKRSSGILLHPTSLPGPYGIGAIGIQAHRWIDFLAEAGCGLWQVLPLGPTGYGDSPYQCFSAFAGNPYLISIETMLHEGLLKGEDLVDQPNFPDNWIYFGPVIDWKVKVLNRAYERFRTQTHWQAALDTFRHEQSLWLDDFALFMAIKEAHGGAPWWTWEADLRDRQADALASARQTHALGIERQVFRQFVFFRQWQAVRNHANEHNIQIVGDIPIFVAHDSADVWANPDLFYLEADGRPTVVAGVPPDYFSATGQLWGNPLYRWDVHAARGYDWWLARIRAVLNLVDIIRVDHFRGFAGYWEIPGDALTAVQGRWVSAPGMEFFQTVRSSLGTLPIIAEDLGVITPDVEEIRDRFELPGMKVLQFAFYGDPAEPSLPHNFTHPNCVVYTGTHDNDTSRGWFERVSNTTESDFASRYLQGADANNIAWKLINLAWSSVAVFAIAPFQDFLNLGNEARMNYPGNPSGNWVWRMSFDALNENLRNSIAGINYLYSRSKD